MKILTSEQIRATDGFTIREEPILSIDLMERAAMQLFYALVRFWPQKSKMSIFAGPGNNGGDGIALARMLAEANYPVDLFLLKASSGLSHDAEVNLKRIPELPWLKVNELKEENPLPDIEGGSLVIDALFGSGLTRALKGFPVRIVHWLNESGCEIMSIDIPSGLFGEDPGPAVTNAVIRADKTLTLQLPKLSFFFPENEEYVGDWEVLDIGLHPDFIREVKTNWHYFDVHNQDRAWMKRKKFDHKGCFGHALLAAGSKGKMGAVVLSARAALRSGLGLLTCHVPGIGYNILQTTVPEAMISCDTDPDYLSFYTGDEVYSAIGLGPGIGTGSKQTKFLFDLITKSRKPLVLDADALNILAVNKDWLDKLPPKTILSPHPGEYKRLFGADENHFERLIRLREICNKYNIIVVLKGAHTVVCNPEGQIWFNCSGNPGMATAGSGDALTGIILSLLDRGLEPETAALWGVYLHGRAGDLAADEKGQDSLIASDIIEQLTNAFIL
ncbi:MAG: NAD(P)H-hydrate dehydratase [Bacteroidetes bacterium]|nr:NAD(P)H-hydrate dehydratase [Bacteroidota bacterium]